MKKEYRVNFMTAADYAKNCASDYARVNSQAVIVTAENAEQATEQVKAMFPAMVVFQGVDIEQEKEYNAILTADLEKELEKIYAKMAELEK